MAQTAFGSHGEPGLEWYHTKVLVGGQNRDKALYNFRKHLRNKAHCGAESNYFRTHYVAGFSPEMTSISGLKCSQGCSHVFGSSAGEKQVWEHTTSLNAQLPSKLETAVLEARKRKAKTLSSYFETTKQARAAAPAADVLPDAPPTNMSDSALIRARATGHVVDVTSDSNKSDDCKLNLGPVAHVKEQRRSCKGFRLPLLPSEYPCAVHGRVEVPWRVVMRYLEVTVYAQNCTSFAGKSQDFCDCCAFLEFNPKLKDILRQVCAPSGLVKLLFL